MKITDYGKPRTAISATTIAIVFLLLVVAVSAVYVVYPKSPLSQSIGGVGNAITGTATTSDNQQTQQIGTQANGLGGLSCLGASGSNGLTLGSNLPVRSTLTHYGGASLATLVDNRFSLQTVNGQTQLVQVPDTGASTDGTAATGSQGFNPQSTWVEQYSAAAAYPQWVTVGANNFGQTIQQGNGASYTFGCYSPSIGLYDWNGIQSLISAPASGGSATTNVKLIVTSSAGSGLGTAATLMPTTSLRWDVITEISSPYSGAVEPTTVYGTASTPVTNFGPLTAPAAGSPTNSAPVQLGAYLLIFSNQTGISIQLDPQARISDPLAVIVTPNTGLNTAATKEWIIGPLAGCLPSGGGASTTNYYYCNDLPIDIYETASQGTHHVDLSFQMRDMTQGGWLAANAYTSAAVSNGFPAAGSAAGAVSSFTVAIPTTGNNAGNPAVLTAQDYATIQTY